MRYLINSKKSGLILIILGIQLIVSAQTLLYEIDSVNPISGTKSLKITNPLPEFNFGAIEKIFGFDGQNRYSYCPSVVKLDDGTIHMFYCGNPNPNVMVDNIYHLRINPDGSKTTEKSVLQPGVSGSWDDHHTCDPSIIGGDFTMNGTNYKYALFYLSNKNGVYYNEIGVAFSSDLEADSWVKYPNQVVTKPWSEVGDQYYSVTGKSWGVGQPSAISLDHKGHVLLTYTVGDKYGSRIEWSELDMATMDTFSPVTTTKMVKTGLMNFSNTAAAVTCNSDFGLDVARNMMVMVRPLSSDNTIYPAYINEYQEVDCISFSDFANSTGSWRPMAKITPSLTNYARNHNAGIERNIYGEIGNWASPVIYYTVSKASPDVSNSYGKHAEWTYSIWRVKINN